MTKKEMAIRITAALLNSTEDKVKNNWKVKELTRQTKSVLRSHLILADRVLEQSKKRKAIWTVESYVTERVYGVFGSKALAFAAIEMWATGANQYKVITDISEIEVDKDTPCGIDIKYISGHPVTLYIRRSTFNNGVGIIYAFKDHFDENGEKK